MNQEEAMKLVRALLFGAQRTRSASREELARNFDADIVNNVLVDLNPWLDGSRSKAFLKTLAQIDERGSVTGLEFYNLMTIIHNLEPVIAVTAGIMSDTIFPEPDISWLRTI